MHTLVLLAFLQSPLAAEPVRSGCSRDARQIATVGAGDRVEVVMAMAGEEETCYKITLVRPEGNATGYVLGDSLPAVAAFVHRREKISGESAAAEARLLLARSAPKASEKESSSKPTDPFVSTQFEEFSGRDLHGKSVSLSGLKARVILVNFWSPNSSQSQSQLTGAMPLYNQFHRSGLAAVGVSMDPNPNHILAGLDDVSPAWPQIPDTSGLAAHYQVDPKAGKTFVLDSSHRVVAAGTMGPEMEKAIRLLLAQ